MLENVRLKMHKRINERPRARVRVRLIRHAEIVYEHLICHRLRTRNIALSDEKKHSRRIRLITSFSKLAPFRGALAPTHSRRFSATCDIAGQTIHLTGHQRSHHSFRNDHSRVLHYPLPYRVPFRQIYTAVTPLTRYYASGRPRQDTSRYFGGFSTVMYVPVTSRRDEITSHSPPPSIPSTPPRTRKRSINSSFRRNTVGESAE